MGPASRPPRRAKAAAAYPQHTNAKALLSHRRALAAYAMIRRMGKPLGRGTKPGASTRIRGVRAVSDLVGQAGGAAFRRFGFVQHAIVSRWPEIVGPRYA